MSDSKKTTTRERRKVERPAPEKGAGKPDGAVDDGELEGVAGGVNHESGGHWGHEIYNPYPRQYDGPQPA